MKYFHTLRHLRLIQLYGLFRYRVIRGLQTGPHVVEGAKLNEAIQAPRCLFLDTLPSLHGTQITFLNHTIDYSRGMRWDDPAQAKLWRYHLHYMDFLHQRGMTTEAAREWMRSWARDNTDTSSEGWEPFPTSLRLANWFKLWWQAGDREVDASLLASAYAQARHLRRFVEFHIQGNHLFENFKSLFWAGWTLHGREAKQWRLWAARRLRRELEEQILSDGGHYERSPMYHAYMVEGCLDLLNIHAAWGAREPDLSDLLHRKTSGMLAWLETMTHPDGEIALLNDAAFKMAPAPHRLLHYGRQLGLDWSAPARVTQLNDSGYLVIRDNGHFLILDIGPFGLDHQPSHGHCDMFSFEWSLGTQRVICDSGVYAYQDPVMRPYVRSTAAHNTVRIDGEDQSEVWKEFRVARRAYPEISCVKATADGAIRVSGCHRGYGRLRGRPVHQRTFLFHQGHLSLLDEITGSGYHELEAFVHLHPAVTIKPQGEQSFDLFLMTCKIGQVHYKHWQQAALHQSWYCPEFGKRESRSVLHLRSCVHLPFTGRVDICLDHAPLSP